MFDPEDGGRTVLRNVDIQPRHYIEKQPRKRVNCHENITTRIGIIYGTALGGNNKPQVGII